MQTACHSNGYLTMSDMLLQLSFKFDVCVVTNNYRIPLGISDHVRAETDLITWLWRVSWFVHFLVLQKEMYISHAQCLRFPSRLHCAL